MVVSTVKKIVTGKRDRGWWIREWDGLALSSIGWLDKKSLMGWQLKKVKKGSMGSSEHSKKREQWAWRVWSGNIHGASSSSREARVVRREVKGRQVGNEDKGYRVEGQIIYKSKQCFVPWTTQHVFPFLIFRIFSTVSVISRHPERGPLHIWCPFKAMRETNYVLNIWEKEIVLTFRFWNWATCVQILTLSCIFG